LRKLSQRVKSGGVVGIIDLAPSDKVGIRPITHSYFRISDSGLQHWANITPEMKKMMHKSGFTEEEMKGYMSEAGLLDFEMIWLPNTVAMPMKNDQEVERRVFFARGKKQ
jgi:hypothetical protein